jgi:hypothetical protein
MVLNYSDDVFTFDPSRYGATFAELIDPERLSDLGPGTPVEGMRNRLQLLDLDAAFAPHSVRDAQMARACWAGLWLLYDFLDESHALSQEIDNTTGNYWHGLMHRREPDFANAAYWFRRVGRHPVFEKLLGESARLATSTSVEPTAKFLKDLKRWNPFAFIDLCEAVAAGKARCQLLCQQVQRCEWQMLFDYSYWAATRSDRERPPSLSK